jgi:hypothetical protein
MFSTIVSAAYLCIGFLTKLISYQEQMGVLWQNLRTKITAEINKKVSDNLSPFYENASTVASQLGKFPAMSF